MPVKALKRKRSVSQSKRRAKAIEKMVEDRAEEILYKHNLFDIKILIALIVIGIASFVVTSFAATLNTVAATTTPSVTATSSIRMHISPTADATTVSRIIIPTASTTPVQVAKWNLMAKSETLVVNKIKVAVINSDFSVRNSASEFGTLSLYGNNGKTLLGSTTLANGYATFSNLNIQLLAGQVQTVSLRATINGSGIMKEKSMIAFGFDAEALKGWSVKSQITGEIINPVSLLSYPSRFGIGSLTPLNLYHNTAPIITTKTDSSVLPLLNAAPIFKFTIVNPGDREMRLTKMLLDTSVGGLATSATTSIGFINDFKLYDANFQGGLGSKLAEFKACVTSPMATGPKTGTTTVPWAGTCYLSNVHLTFDQTNDVNNLFDSLTILAGGSRTFILVANTTNSLQGKVSGGVSVMTKILGGTGPAVTIDPKKPRWSDGGIWFRYSPVGGTENTVDYRESDSYPVIGNQLSLII